MARYTNASSSRHPSSGERALESAGLELGLLELLERRLLMLDRVERHLVLNVLLVAVEEKLLDDGSEVRVIGERLGPLRLPLVKLAWQEQRQRH